MFIVDYIVAEENLDKTRAPLPNFIVESTQLARIVLSWSVTLAHLKASKVTHHKNKGQRIPKQAATTLRP